MRVLGFLSAAKGIYQSDVTRQSETRVETIIEGAGGRVVTRMSWDRQAKQYHIKVYVEPTLEGFGEVCPWFTRTNSSPPFGIKSERVLWEGAVDEWGIIPDPTSEGRATTAGEAYRRYFLSESEREGDDG